MPEAQIPTPSQSQAAEPIPQQNQPDNSSAPPAANAPAQTGKNIMLPQAAFKERIQNAKASGRRELTSELDKDAQSLGYASHAAMIEMLRARKGQPAAARPNADQNRAPAQASSQQSTEHQAPPPLPKNGQDRKAFARFEQDKRALERDRQQLQKQLADEAQRRKKAERRASAAEARANLERIAAGCGVKRIGQAIYLFEEAQRGKTVEELERIDEAKFFEGLRQSDPYLFGEAVIPATTGTTSSPPGARTPPRPAETSTAAGEAGNIDAMAMTDEQFSAHQRKRGIRTVPMGLG